MILTAPDDLVAGKEAVVVLSVEPVDSEISTVQLKQTPQFKFTTTCEGMDCFVNAALDFENPQTRSVCWYSSGCILGDLPQRSKFCT